MRLLKIIIPLIFQSIWTSIVMLLVYMIVATVDVYEGGIPETVGFLLFQPLFGIILVIATIAACLLMGLPIRLNSRLNSWWLAHQIIPISGVVIGLMLLAVSFHPHLTTQKVLEIEGSTISRSVANMVTAVLGWCMMTFCLLHLFPRWLENVLHRLAQLKK